MVAPPPLQVPMSNASATRQRGRGLAVARKQADCAGPTAVAQNRSAASAAAGTSCGAVVPHARPNWGGTASVWKDVRDRAKRQEGQGHVSPRRLVRDRYPGRGPELYGGNNTGTRPTSSSSPRQSMPAGRRARPASDPSMNSRPKGAARLRWPPAASPPRKPGAGGGG